MFAKGRGLLKSEFLKRRIFYRRCRFSVHSFSEWPVLLSFLQFLLSQVLALLLWVPKSIWTQSVYHLSSHFHAPLFSTLKTTLSLWIPLPFSQPPVPVLSTILQVQALEDKSADFWALTRLTQPLKGSGRMCSVLLGLCHREYCKISSLRMIIWGFCLFTDLVLFRLQNLGTIVMTFYRYRKNIWGWCHQLNLKSMLLNPWGRWDFSCSHNTFFFLIYGRIDIYHVSVFALSNLILGSGQRIVAEMTQPEADTWPGKLLPKQKSNCKQIKIVLYGKCWQTRRRLYYPLYL